MYKLDLEKAEEPEITLPKSAGSQKKQKSSDKHLALESITTKKASGGDGIPAELFQILKDDAVKQLHLTCQQIWTTQQWTQD